MKSSEETETVVLAVSPGGDNSYDVRCTVVRRGRRVWAVEEGGRKGAMVWCKGPDAVWIPDVKLVDHGLASTATVTRVRRLARQIEGK